MSIARETSLLHRIVADGPDANGLILESFGDHLTIGQFLVGKVQPGSSEA